MSDVVAVSKENFGQTDKKAARRRRKVVLANGTLASFGISLATGLYLYLFADMNWNVGQLALGLHIGLGILAVVLLSAWMFDHLLPGIKKAENRLFFWMSWLFLGTFVSILVTGIMQALPSFLYLGGIIWFYKFETYDLIGTIHLILAFTTFIGLLAHLSLPHWKGNDKS